MFEVNEIEENYKNVLVKDIIVFKVIFFVLGF